MKCENPLCNNEVFLTNRSGNSKFCSTACYDYYYVASGKSAEYQRKYKARLKEIK